MTDLLTHVLFAYVVVTIVSWRHEWLGPYVPVAMIGAIIPDLAKGRLLFSQSMVVSMLGMPFSWTSIHRLGGTLAVAGLGALCFPRQSRRRAFGFLVFGAATEFLLDTGLIRANGVTPPYLYPLSWWQFPTAGFYLSSDLWPSLVAVVAGTVVWLLDGREVGISC